MVDLSARRGRRDRGEVERERAARSSADVPAAPAAPAIPLGGETTTAAADVTVPLARPCASCKTNVGRPASKGTRPARRDAEPFGYPWGSLVCQCCFQRLKDRADKKRAFRPCSRCGTNAGYRRPADLLPMRYACDRFGLAFGDAGQQWCHECVMADPAASAAVFGGRGRGGDRAWAPKREAIVAQAAAIVAALEGRCRAAEARRVAEAVAASRWVTPAEGAARARKEYWDTFFGKRVRKTA